MLGLISMGWLLYSCDQVTSQRRHPRTEATETKDTVWQISPDEKEVLDFVKSGKFKYSTYKSGIPEGVMDTSTIGDSTQREQVDLTDARLLNKDGKDPFYNKLLQFVLVNPECCLVVYTEGGRGAHQIILYQRNNGKKKRMVLQLSYEIVDTSILRQALRKPISIEDIE